MLIRIYKNSILATIVSIMGTAFALGGVYMIIEGDTEAIPLVIIGVALMFGASAISKNKVFKTWVKGLKEKGILEQLPTNDALCRQVYQANPGKKTLALLEKYNPRMADELRSTGVK